MFPRQPRTLYLLVACAWVIVLAGIFYLAVQQIRDASIDFLSYYVGASGIQEGKPLYTLETHESVSAALGIRQVGLYLYPPTLALLLRPFLWLSPYVASLLWFFVNVGLLLIGVYLLLRAIDLQDHRMKAALWLLPVVFTPVLMTLYLGQVNILIFMLIVLVWLTFVHGRRYTPGALLALAAWIKVWPILLIGYFVWKRQWKVVSGAVIGLLLIGALTIGLGGAGQTTSFFTDRFPEIAQGTEPGIDHLNQSIPGVFAKLFAPSSDYVLPLVRSPILAQQGSRIAMLLLVIATVVLSSQPIALKSREQFSTEFMLVVIAVMLITGRLFESNLTLLLPAYFLIAEELHHEGGTSWRQLVVPIASVLLIDLHRVIWTAANPDKQPLPWFLLSFPFLGVLLLWFHFAVKRLREIRSPRGDYLSQPLEPALPPGASLLPTTNTNKAGQASDRANG
jgi:hypothetical protein